jgi:hypothetical protein
MITTLTPEQEALIPIYQEKWMTIALSIEPIEPQKAEAAVLAACAALGQQQPEMIFGGSPGATR